MFDEHHNETVTQSSVPHTEGVSTHSGGPVTERLPNGNLRVTREERHTPKQTEVAHRNRIPCQECDGHGVYSIANSLDPYAKLYECETCDGMGFEAEELDPDRLREDRDEREMLRKEWAE